MLFLQKRCVLKIYLFADNRIILLKLMKNLVRVEGNSNSIDTIDTAATTGTLIFVSQVIVRYC